MEFGFPGSRASAGRVPETERQRCRPSAADLSAGLFGLPLRVLQNGDFDGEWFGRRVETPLGISALSRSGGANSQADRGVRFAHEPGRLDRCSCPEITPYDFLQTFTYCE